MRQQSRERHLTLDFVGPDRPVMVMGDGVRLEQILSNLLTNAFKYTPAGGHVQVTVSHDEETSQALLSISDTGMGISTDMLQTIFDPFTQSQRTLDRAQGGMGLGLSVVRALVQLHGGQVTAASAGLGHGSTFAVRLPIIATLPTEDRSPLRASRSNGSSSRRRILIVEDSVDNRETLTELLEAIGHDVAVAADGESGIERALAYHPEVVLIDIGLPGLDGFEVARRIRAAVGAEIFLVALTGYGQPEDRARALAAGFDVHITKPISLDTLENVIER
jgi:CheY-like chemotaxis protein